MSCVAREPEDVQRPIGEVSFEGLQQAGPCG
jgi:hypothetical protein